MPTINEKRTEIENAYFDGNHDHADFMFKSLSKADRKEFALDVIDRTYLMEVNSHRTNQYYFAKFLIESI